MKMRRVVGGFCMVVGVFLALSSVTDARNIIEYSDTISDSAPDEVSNHTFRFQLITSVGGNSYLEFDWPTGFELNTTPVDFDVRNVELLVDGSPRVASTTASVGVDQVDITRGDGGRIRYTLAPDGSISAGSDIEFRVGNQTSGAIQPFLTFSTSTGTTTDPGDPEPIRNPNATGTQEIDLRVIDSAVEVADAGFLITMIEKVGIAPIDTTEEIPPFRFNGQPTSTVSGTTPNVEISLETDEFAFCRYSTTPGVAFNAMSDQFTNSGLIFHSTVVPVTPNSIATFYVRCIDDEDNFNIDDFVITFTVDEIPTGTSNTEGNTDGDGTGSGDSGTGDGDGGGGTTGASDGEEPEAGGDTGTGGSGGGGGGGSGGSSGSRGGGGFESRDGPFRSGDGRVVITGLAFPDSEVTFLVDGTRVDSVRAEDDGSYEVTIDEIARGAYTFGVSAEGDDGVMSSPFSTSFTVTGARTTALSNINVPPSIEVSPDPVNPGETLTLSGYAIANAEITIENGRLDAPSVNTIQTTSDNDGRWTTTVNTSSFTNGTYQVRARAEQPDGDETAFSDYSFYGVGQEADVPLNTDLNRDGSVNLTDFSILLFWWDSNGGDSDPPADINRDGRVSLTDFSILLFNWTG